MAYTKVKTPAEIESLRAGGRILAKILQELKALAVAGTTGLDLDKRARQLLSEAGAEGATLGYHGFPAVICVSVNDAVVHGIPNDIPFEDGDVVSIDFVVSYQGMITDAALTVFVGKNPSTQIAQLIRDTETALQAGIEQVRDGVRVGEIAHAIEEVLNASKLGIVRDLVGHGVGHELHEEPNIPNYGPDSSGPTLLAGMTIAIEPMATIGDYRVYIEDDGWTVKTADRSLAAHFEHTVLITKDGAEILTAI